MKVKLNPTIEEYKGAMGEMVFKTHKGKLIVCKKPKPGAPSEAQLAHRERFLDATMYAKFAMEDGDLHDFYEAVSLRKNLTPHTLAVTDFLTLPKIKTFDLTKYNGQIGSIIKLTTKDDSGVVNANVVIRDGQDANIIIESGDAVETPQGSGYWVYVTKASVPSGKIVVVYANAADRPGGLATKSTTITIP